VSQSASARAGRLHAALSATFEGLHSTVGGASFERRTGHVRLLLPSVPIAVFNGVLVESEPCSGIGDWISEVEERGLPCGVQLREGQHPEVEAEARAMGLTERTPMPGMALAFEELVEASCDALDISRVEDEEGLLDAATVAAGSFGAPPAVLQALYRPEVVELDGMNVYLGRVEAEAVTTAIGYRTGREGAIFIVATPVEHRRHGYGAAITSFATRSLFESGADLAWLQTSPMGERVYYRLGFRQVANHILLSRPNPQSS
jgi:ribosomal protein S18 acetylase RimI-like enzyme